MIEYIDNIIATASKESDENAWAFTLGFGHTISPLIIESQPVVSTPRVTLILSLALCHSIASS
jgi:hypothetical protein